MTESQHCYVQRVMEVCKAIRGDHPGSIAAGLLLMLAVGRCIMQRTFVALAVVVSFSTAAFAQYQSDTGALDNIWRDHEQRAYQQQQGTRHALDEIQRRNDYNYHQNRLYDQRRCLPKGFGIADDLAKLVRGHGRVPG